ncbi:MAG: tRNA guanosine(34) transglycosylase Tgt [Oscillospiraceae bacterium]|nr:tRNA guanosine(34) transglycosylase Tgt [Oscillospiraceae bacterium]
MFILKEKQGKARRGEFTTSRGKIQTPVFMNVATQAAIKGAVSAEDLKTVGCQVALANTYHLHIRPGDQLILSLGGLHKFMNWDGPILTDSGGFQVFSLAGLRKITEDGAAFSSHVDGRKFFMSPEDSVRIQANLGADIAMAFDECIEIPAPREYVEKSCERTYRWLVRCIHELEKIDGQTPILFGINQGAAYADIRISHMKKIAELNLPGYAIGGLAVGETTEQMYQTIEDVEPYMPEDRPRYLMGVGTPLNLIEAVLRGIDFFDCVMPARNGRHGRLFTWGGSGSININNERFKDDNNPIDSACNCPTCTHYSRAYIRHLFKSGEMLAMRLAVLHNLHYYNALMAKIRDAIEENTLESLANKFRQMNNAR